MSAWQPIETAPKDGTWFLICRNGDPSTLEVGCFNQLMWDTYVEIEDGLYRKELSEPIDNWRGFDNFPRATHWMPIPALPAESRGGDSHER